MAAFFLWCILFIICWPLALLAIVLFPIVWLITLPFRILGIAVHGVFALLAAILFLVTYDKHRLEVIPGRPRPQLSGNPNICTGLQHVVCNKSLSPPFPGLYSY